VVDEWFLVWYAQNMEQTTLIIIAVAVLAALNFLSVFGAMATLRWMDHRQKKAIADIFMRELGEKLQTEQSFQNIVQNMNMTGNIKPTEEEDDNNE